jgi:hypothetical protein
MSFFKYGVGQGANYLNSPTPPPGYAPPVSAGQGGAPGWLSALGASDLPGGGFGGNKSFRVGDDVYTGAYTEGNPDAGVGPAYVGDFYKYKYNPQAWAGKGSVLNGTGYERFNTAGKSLGTGTWEGISDKDYTLDNIVTALVGGAFGGVALAGAGVGGAGAASAGGGTGAATGADLAAFYGGLDGGATLGGGASVAGGSSLGAVGGSGALGAGAGVGESVSGAYSGPAAQAPLTGVPPPANPYLSGAGSGLFGAGGAGAGELSWGALIGPAAQLVGAGIGANAAQGTSDDLLQASREAAARFEPWTQAGGWSIGQAANMLGKNGPEAAKAAFQVDPGYQWRLSQGENALTRMASARGGLNSGKFYKDGMRFNQGEASQEFGNSLNRLLAVAGMGQTATGSAADYGTQGANAAAAGRVGAANLYTNALSQGASMYNNQQQQQQNNALMNALATRMLRS